MHLRRHRDTERRSRAHQHTSSHTLPPVFDGVTNDYYYFRFLLFLFLAKCTSGSWQRRDFLYKSASVAFGLH